MNSIKPVRGSIAVALLTACSASGHAASIGTPELRPAMWTMVADVNMLPANYREGARLDGTPRSFAGASPWAMYSVQGPVFAPPMAVELGSSPSRPGSTSESTVNRQGLELPEPGRASAAIATLLLALFFLARRLPRDVARAPASPLRTAATATQ